MFHTVPLLSRPLTCVEQDATLSRMPELANAGLRLSAEEIGALDAIAARRSTEARARVSRQDVMRAVIQDALRKLQAEVREIQPRRRAGR